MVLPISFVDAIDNMRVFGRKGKEGSSGAVASGAATPRQEGGPLSDAEKAEKGELENSPIRLFRMRIVAMVVIVSIGGLIFGYGEFQ
jgi:hypothetical protein